MGDLSPEYLTKIFPVFKSEPLLAENILTRSIHRSIARDTTIYWEGDSCTHIALILSGEIRVYKASPGSREITLYEIGPGETCILNASCIISNTSYPANAVTLTDLEILSIPAGYFRELMESTPNIQHFIFTQLSQRLASVMTLLEEVVFNRMDERLQDHLIEKSENNRLKASHQTIANDLGTSREVVSRLLKDMERKGMVLLSRNSIKLLNLQP